MAHMQNIEVLVREFLAYRGFFTSLKYFESECKSDKSKSFRVDKIIESIQVAINASDLQELRDIWKNLDNFFFSKLEQNYAEAVKKLESGIFKIYLVAAHNSGRSERIAEFFVKMANEIHAQNDWREWFYFQYCKNPEEHSTFTVYFTKSYQDTLFLSLHNFLATIFQSMPLPTLMRIESETAQIKKLQEENSKLRQRLQMTLSQQQQVQTGMVGSLGGHQHQSRQQIFMDKKTRIGNATNPNEIIPFDIQPPAHLVDDFFIIAQESLSISENQSRGFKSIIRNISSGTSPVMGRKESSQDGSKGSKRSGSVGNSRQ
ncbi:hypothetical protein PVAND_015533 [Polypedilum vanderplanki]|uniref:ARMC9 CTLH-like domain-containing protein n=1 Tax=Polypedilum vanderplanki TaxID=319348 RepID=A0A9J6BCX0_POLVA|nr:hypothetical protein PVAND_015533 [Polypedilum vanderplanki]